MRIPKISKYNTDSPYDVIELPSLDLPRNWYNFANKRDKDKWIKSVEHLCRGSLEYTELIKFLKQRMGMDFCSFFHSFGKKRFPKAKLSIEIHHEPFTLYDIIAIVLNHHLNVLEEVESPNMYEIASEVMEEHYAGHVGLIPLSVTVHQCVHSGKVFIPLQFIDDGFHSFLDKYNDSISLMPGMFDNIKAKIELSGEFMKDPEGFMSILKKKYIYVMNEGYESIPDVSYL